ncbi:MAG: DUF3310 domain-containing protein [Pseudonocardia sp.]|nr:DUF3310 domain-containing protein [Pseudonocardia sp.]
MINDPFDVLSSRLLSDEHGHAIPMAEALGRAVDLVNHPPHYRHPSGIECIEITRHCSFDLGNAIKYIWRADAKNGAQDLRKAQWYLRDILSTGQCSFPPHKAKHLLIEANMADHDEQRVSMLAAICQGRLDAAIMMIDEVIDASVGDRL